MRASRSRWKPLYIRLKVIYMNRKSSYPYYTAVLNLADIEFPITFQNIKKFENLNVSINVYGIEDKQILPLRLTGDKKEKYISLLYQNSRDDSISHFAWIKDLPRLVRSQIAINWEQE